MRSRIFCFFAGEMLVEPVLEKWRNGPGQPHDRITGKLRAGLGARFHDFRHLVIGQARDDRSDHDPHGNPRGAQGRTASRRAAGDEVRGSSTRWTFGSSDVTETFTAAA